MFTYHTLHPHGVVQIWRESLAALCKHFGLILPLAFIGFFLVGSLPGVLRVVIGLNMLSNPAIDEAIQASYRSGYDAMILAQLAGSAVLSCLCQAAITWIALCHIAHVVPSLKSAIAAAIARMPLLLASGMVYAALTAASVIALVHSTSLALQMNAPAELYTYSRHTNTMMPVLFSTATQLPYALAPGGSSDLAVLALRYLPDIPTFTLSPLALAVASIALLILVEGTLRLRTASIMSGIPSRAAGNLARSTLFSFSHAGRRLILSAWLLRLGTFSIRAFCIILPLTMLQFLVLPELVSVIKVSKSDFPIWLFFGGLTGIVVALIETPLLAFSAIYDAYLIDLVDKHDVPVRMASLRI